MPKMKRVGYWLSEKKRKKLNFDDFANLCRTTDLDLVQVDLSQPLDNQGPFDVFIHKLTDVISKADDGNVKEEKMLRNLQDYVDRHPNLVVIDPIEAVRTLLSRYTSYSLIRDCNLKFKDTFPRICTPNFVQIDTQEKDEIMKLLNSANVEFPIVCKPLQAHGCEFSHQMAIIFNEEGLKDVRPPCVAQTFINHNAKLHKLFVIGDYYYTVQRPSVKNFTAGDQRTIFFDSHDVSKANSSSFLNELDKEDLDELEGQPPCIDRFSELAFHVRSQLGASLFGIDIIVENETGTHAVIDINAFPGYDGVPQFYHALMAHIHNQLGNYKRSDEIMEDVCKTASFIKSAELVRDESTPTAKQNGNYQIQDDVMKHKIANNSIENQF